MVRCSGEIFGGIFGLVGRGFGGHMGVGLNSLGSTDKVPGRCLWLSRGFLEYLSWHFSEAHTCSPLLSHQPSSFVSFVTCLPSLLHFVWDPSPRRPLILWRDSRSALSRACSLGGGLLYRPAAGWALFSALQNVLCLFFFVKVSQAP